MLPYLVFFCNLDDVVIFLKAKLRPRHILCSGDSFQIRCQLGICDLIVPLKILTPQKRPSPLERNCVTCLNTRDTKIAEKPFYEAK